MADTQATAECVQLIQVCKAYPNKPSPNPELTPDTEMLVKLTEQLLSAISTRDCQNNVADGLSCSPHHIPKSLLEFILANMGVPRYQKWYNHAHHSRMESMMASHIACVYFAVSMLEREQQSVHCISAHQEAELQGL